jgi:dTDP-4-amino-4,6-dideoxygalactose transaminase
MDKIMKIAKKNGLLVVEDCAAAYGSEWNRKKLEREVILEHSVFNKANR